MNKIFKNGIAVQSRLVRKTFLIMRLTTILLLSAMFASAASSYSQTAKFSMELNNVTLKQVFHEIEKTSKFIIVYSDDIVNANQKVDVKVDDVTVENVLEQALVETNLTYKISERQIAITKKVESALINSVQQKKTLSGLVNDGQGLPLPGVTIILKGTTTGAVTNSSGEFTLDVPEAGGVLVFSFVGFQAQEVEIGNQTLFNITLIEDVLQLDEVIAVGYGVQRKIDQTGATNRLTEENMNKSIATSPVEMMQGRVSGVNIVQNSGEPGS